MFHTAADPDTLERVDQGEEIPLCGLDDVCVCVTTHSNLLKHTHTHTLLKLHFRCWYSVTAGPCSTFSLCISIRSDLSHCSSVFESAKTKKFAKCKWQDDFMLAVLQCLREHYSLIVRRVLKIWHCLCIFAQRMCHEHIRMSFKPYKYCSHNMSMRVCVYVCVRERGETNWKITFVA